MDFAERRFCTLDAKRTMAKATGSGHSAASAMRQSKKKRDKIIGTTLAVAFVAIIAGAIILTFVNEFKSYQESRPNYNRTEMVVPDYTGITSESSAAE